MLVWVLSLSHMPGISRLGSATGTWTIRDVRTNASLGSPKSPLSFSGGSARESNPPTPLVTRHNGFEVRRSHRAPSTPTSYGFGGQPNPKHEATSKVRNYSRIPVPGRWIPRPPNCCQDQAAIRWRLGTHCPDPVHVAPRHFRLGRRHFPPATSGPLSLALGQALLHRSFGEV